MRALGICCGASTITVVEAVRGDNGVKVNGIDSRSHNGNPKQTIREILASKDLEKFDRMASTGRKLRHLLNLTSISEPMATESAVAHVRKRYPKINAVVSAGGETFMVYRLDAEGRISKVYTGNKCAAGTGEFFLQQIRRMDVSTDDAAKYARSETPYPVSGRCSVFCKSDCTHAVNKGVPKGEVVAGLCRMMADKVVELLRNLPRDRSMIVGGTARNQIMIDYLRQQIRDLVVPEEAEYFEALGAAVWALENRTANVDSQGLFTGGHSGFEYHRPLREFEDRVTFAQMEQGCVQAGDACILGLDVGSTTTKAVIIRQSDRKIIASEYLRTNGDPVEASKACYRSLKGQVGGAEIMIEGLGVTGSGRKIAGLHALTDGVINEIIAHATAAIYFDRDVDTIFEIGGQDAKYTYITNGVASDYAMNEACSAGTGSFLEESAWETLGIRMEDIADWALRGDHPPNFNDQCAAFISSDIKNASHEGVSKEDTVAGLVYSICMNYVNRVKGSRPMGRKIFMQGGVCCNRAVPIAMAALSGKEIIVPPEPALMGAYGVALEILDRIEKGLMQRDGFSLDTLICREVGYGQSFVCRGGKEKCDIGCEIKRILIEGRVYPFGGACNRYYNLLHHMEVDSGEIDLVTLRQQMVFDDYAADLSDLPESAPTIGLNRSFLMNTLYPFFSHYFREIGFRPLLPDQVDPEGVDARSAPFCYPMEIAHGFFHNLLQKRPDHIFIPHLHGLEVKNGYSNSKLCPLVQGEPFVLNAAFEQSIGRIPIHRPFLQFNKGRPTVRRQLVRLGRRLGVSAAEAGRAFDIAWQVQRDMEAAMHAKGWEALHRIEADPNQIGIVLFGRSYNAYAAEANKGIPRKFASRGYTVIPLDFLDVRDVLLTNRMYWSMGQLILKSAALVKEHPQLFGAYITNFSCGPDSFIIGFFRNLLGRKPSLTLELDNHTADAGLETRIEAFLDIVERYRAVKIPEQEIPVVEPARSSLQRDVFEIRMSSGEKVLLTDPRVKLVFPSMSRWASPVFAAACRHFGIRSEALPEMTEQDLKTGKGNTLCKECLPLQLTTGAFLNYLSRRPENEVTVYFMPTTEGPCRFGQYREFMQALIERRAIRDVTFLSLSSNENYAGLGPGFVMLGWYASVVADCFESIRNLMLVNAVDPGDAETRLSAVFDRVVRAIDAGGKRGLMPALSAAADELAGIPMRVPAHDVPTILLAGEIYVRSEGLARRWIPEYLARYGIACYTAPINEWVHYTNYTYNRRLNDLQTTGTDRLKNRLRSLLMTRSERNVQRILSRSGWLVQRSGDLNEIMKSGRHFISPDLIGEAILTVGSAFAEVGRDYCGVIAIGPFGCMPNRLSEAILNRSLDRSHLMQFRADRETARITSAMESMPFLAIESDGCPFPQLITAQLETFVLQARRLHRIMENVPAAVRNR